MVLVQLFENIVTFISRAGLMQGQEVSTAAASVAIDQRRQVLAIKADGCWIHDHDALDHVTRLTDVSGPGLSHQALNGVITYLPSSAALPSRNFVHDGFR